MRSLRLIGLLLWLSGLLWSPAAGQTFTRLSGSPTACGGEE